MDSYKPGQVSSLLFAKAKKKSAENKNLALLFSPAKQVKPKEVTSTKQHPSQVTPTPAKVKKVAEASQERENKPPEKHKKVKKNENGKSNLDPNTDNTILAKQSSTTLPETFVHETLLQKNSPATSKKKAVKRKLEKSKADDDEHIGKRPRRDRKRDKRADNRTIFVGNCPLSADRKTLKNIFGEYGAIETIRFRCAPAAEPNLPRRAIVITKNFHEKGNNYVSYIVFKEEESAKKALEKNGYVLDDLHLRVDMAAASKKHDKKRSIFIGNLPFIVDEETIRSHFADCGEITNVRIVRDRQTSLGKGISYVQFESKDSVSLALKLNKSEVQGRQIRVMICTNKPKKKDEKQTKNNKNSKKPTNPKTKKVAFAPSNATSSKFNAVLKLKKEKRLRKIKKKKDNAKKSDGLSSIFGEPAPAEKKVKIRKKQQKNKVKNFKKPKDQKPRRMKVSSGKRMPKTVPAKKPHMKNKIFSGKGKKQMGGKKQIKQ